MENADGVPRARTSLLPPRLERELSRLERDVVARLVDAGREDVIPLVAPGLLDFAFRDIPGIEPAPVERIGELNREVSRRGFCRCTVVAFDPDEAPVLRGQPTVVWPGA